MQQIITTKKLFKIALITSPLIALFSFMPMLVVDENPLIHNEGRHFEKIIGITFITIIVFFLWLINIFLYKFFERKSTSQMRSQNLRYVLSFLLCAILVAFVSILPKPSSPEVMPPVHVTMKLLPFIGVTANNIMLLIILDLVVLRDKKAKMEIEIVNLTLRNVVAQKEQLKGQIHPHFLFNSLSTLKVLMKKSQSDAEKYLINLSNFLRSSLSYSGADKATLEDEIKHCVEYLQMQKVRFGSALEYTITVPENIQKSVNIPIFSLQMLAENAIKHNKLTKENRLLIQIYTENDLYLRVENNLNPKPTQPTTKLGLENLVKRIELLSNSKRQLKIEKGENYFRVLVPLIIS